MIEELRDLQAAATLGATVSVDPGQSHRAACEIRRRCPPACARARRSGVAGGPARRHREEPSDRQPAGRLAMPKRWRSGCSRGSLIADGPHRRYAAGEPAIFERVTVADIEQWRKERSGARRSHLGGGRSDGCRREPDARSTGCSPACRRRGGAPAPVKPALRAPGKLVVLERAVVQSGNRRRRPDGARHHAGLAAGPARGRGARRRRVGAAVARRARAARRRLRHFGGNACRSISMRARCSSAPQSPTTRPRTCSPPIREEYARFPPDGMTRGGARDAEGDLRAQPPRTLAPGADPRRRSARPWRCTTSRMIILATYEQRVRGYGRSGDRGGHARDVSEAPLTTVVVAPSAEGLRPTA